MVTDQNGGLNPRPFNAPPAGQLPIGVQPGTSTGVFLGRLIIVTSGGPTSGFFVYSGTPALGNPPVAWIAAPGVTTDPFGNTIQPIAGFGSPTGAHFGINSSGDIFLVNSTPVTIFHGRSSDGSFFWYDTSGELLQHLSTSISALPSTTTDAAGNTVQSGLTVYETGLPTPPYVQLFNGAINLFLSSTVTWSMLPANATNGLEFADLHSGHKVQFGPANNAVTLQAFQPATIATLETWHTVTPVAGFTAGGTSPRYQFEAINGGRVRLSGAVNLTANQAAGTTFFTLPANYIPSRVLHFVTQNNLSGYAAGNASLTVDTSGNLQITVAGSTGNFISLDGVCFELD